MFKNLFLGNTKVDFYKKSKLENIYNDTESNKMTTPIMIFIDKIIK